MEEGHIIKLSENFLNLNVGGCCAVSIKRELKGEVKLHLYEKDDNFVVKYYLQRWRHEGLGRRVGLRD